MHGVPRNFWLQMDYNDIFTTDCGRRKVIKNIYSDLDDYLDAGYRLMHITASLSRTLTWSCQMYGWPSMPKFQFINTRSWLMYEIDHCDSDTRRIRSRAATIPRRPLLANPNLFRKPKMVFKSTYSVRLPPARCSQWHQSGRYLDPLKRSRW